MTLDNVLGCHTHSYYKKDPNEDPIANSSSSESSTTNKDDMNDMDYKLNEEDDAIEYYEDELLAGVLERESCMFVQNVVGQDIIL
jgi:hypothetical protein